MEGMEYILLGDRRTFPVTHRCKHEHVYMVTQSDYRRTVVGKRIHVTHVGTSECYVKAIQPDRHGRNPLFQGWTTHSFAVSVVTVQIRHGESDVFPFLDPSDPGIRSQSKVQRHTYVPGHRINHQWLASSQYPHVKVQDNVELRQLRRAKSKFDAARVEYDHNRIITRPTRYLALWRISLPD